MKKLIATMIIAASLMGVVNNAFARCCVQVDGYTKSDGTYVAPHIRTYPDAIKSNNLNY
mgnify:CR=1 FL=1|tara:strand:- start:649 stop:825 length:177 start_codon:yes stop_codon:yes gene_type:complete